MTETIETPSGPEALPTPERLRAVPELVGLQARLLAHERLPGHTAIDPLHTFDRDLEEADMAPAGERPKTYALMGAASTSERTGYWESHSSDADFDAQYAEWRGSILAILGKEKHKKLITGLSELSRVTGIDLAHATEDTIDRLHERYLSETGEEDYKMPDGRVVKISSNMKLFVEDIIKAYEKDDGIDMTALRENLPSILWIARMFGGYSAEIVTQLVHAEAQRRQNITPMIEAVKAPEGGGPRRIDRDGLEHAEYMLLKFLYGYAEGKGEGVGEGGGGGKGEEGGGESENGEGENGGEGKGEDGVLEPVPPVGEEENSEPVANTETDGGVSDSISPVEESDDKKGEDTERGRENGRGGEDEGAERSDESPESENEKEGEDESAERSDEDISEGQDGNRDEEDAVAVAGESGVNVDADRRATDEETKSDEDLRTPDADSSTNPSIRRVRPAGDSRARSEADTTSTLLRIRNKLFPHDVDVSRLPDIEFSEESREKHRYEAEMESVRKTIEYLGLSVALGSVRRHLEKMQKGLKDPKNVNNNSLRDYYDIGSRVMKRIIGELEERSGLERSDAERDPYRDIAGDGRNEKRWQEATKIRQEISTLKRTTQREGDHIIGTALGAAPLSLELGEGLLRNSMYESYKEKGEDGIVRIYIRAIRYDVPQPFVMHQGSTDEMSADNALGVVLSSPDTDIIRIGDHRFRYIENDSGSRLVLIAPESGE